MNKRKQQKSRSSTPNRKFHKEYEIKINQDAYVVVKNFLNLNKNWMFGVFDGHGTEGHKISSEIKMKLPNTIMKRYIKQKKINVNGNFMLAYESPKMLKKDLNQNITSMTQNSKSFKNIVAKENLILSCNLNDIFKDSIHEIDESLGANAEVSGTTCCSVAILGDKLLCANVGDSRAILLSK